MRTIITEDDYHAVKKAEQQTHDKSLSKKLKVILLRYEWKTNEEISQMTGYSISRVTHLISEFNQDGIEEYTRSKYKGNNRNMTYEEEKNFSFHS